MVATVLIVNNQGGKNEAVPTANEVALQAPADPGPAPFTPSVETQGMSAPAPAPTSTAAQPGGTPRTSSPAVLHSVQGNSAGLYGGTMSRSSCDTERLIGMVSSGDAGRAWASAAGIEQSAIPSYLRSLTSAYLRVDTRVTNHSYKSGAVVEYQSVLQAGTAVLVDAQGVPRVRCACGNPLKPAVLVSNAKYTGKAWTGFEPTTLIVVVPAPQPVTEIILVNVETGGWFSRLTGRIEVVDKRVEPPKQLVPGVPPPVPWKPTSPTATASTSGTTSSGATSSGATSSGATSSGATSSGATTSGATSSGATASTSGATSSGATSSGATSSGATSGGTTSSGASTGTGSAAATSSTTSGRPSESTATTHSSSASTLSEAPTSKTSTTGAGATGEGTTTSTGSTSAGATSAGAQTATPICKQPGPTGTVTPCPPATP
ncbi:DUF6777 domain-containing protein [Kitasatospora sp. NPDC059160]|uniref:DUF6777 domain-containing protein n=1 Tax=Kitasatospora sp. NPDC059160 TaxID=3346748 RepID=UPI00367661CA